VFGFVYMSFLFFKRSSSVQLIPFGLQSLLLPKVPLKHDLATLAIVHNWTFLRESLEHVHSNIIISSEFS
jgi:hypothetical protein